MKLRCQRGVAMTVAIMMIVCSSVLAGYALQAGWNQRRMSIQSGSRRDKIYWAAKAGVVDARRRIRANVGGQFTTPAFNPAAYPLDVDGGGNDVCVDIGPEDVNGVRPIVSTGDDNQDGVLPCP